MKFNFIILSILLIFIINNIYALKTRVNGGAGGIVHAQNDNQGNQGAPKSVQVNGRSDAAKNFFETIKAKKANAAIGGQSNVATAAKVVVAPSKYSLSPIVLSVTQRLLPTIQIVNRRKSFLSDINNAIFAFFKDSVDEIQMNALRLSSAIKKSNDERLRIDLVNAIFDHVLHKYPNLQNSIAIKRNEKLAKLGQLQNSNNNIKEFYLLLNEIFEEAYLLMGYYLEGSELHMPVVAPIVVENSSLQDVATKIADTSSNNIISPVVYQITASVANQRTNDVANFEVNMNNALDVFFNDGTDEVRMNIIKLKSDFRNSVDINSRRRVCFKIINAIFDHISSNYMLSIETIQKEINVFIKKLNKMNNFDIMGFYELLNEVLEKAYFLIGFSLNFNVIRGPIIVDRAYNYAKDVLNVQLHPNTKSNFVNNAFLLFESHISHNPEDLKSTYDQLYDNSFKVPAVYGPRYRLITALFSPFSDSVGTERKMSQIKKLKKELIDISNIEFSILLVETIDILNELNHVYTI